MSFKLHWLAIAGIIIAVYLIGVNFPINKAKFTKSA